MAVRTLDTGSLDRLIAGLRSRGHRVVGPVVRDGAIVLDTITSVGDLPAGRFDEQTPGRYRLRAGDGPELFAWAVGPDSLKRLVHPPRTTLWRAERYRGRLRFEPAEEGPPERLAVLGARACDLAGLAALDRALGDGEHADDGYRRRRRELAIVAVDCSSPSASCFCTSLGTGPALKGGQDIGLTECLVEGRHFFVAEATTLLGSELLVEVGAPESSRDELDAAAAVRRRARRSLRRRLVAEDRTRALDAALDHRRWGEVAARCLACGACTLVCPTCFCTSVEEAVDPSGERTEHRRRWDSCFTTSFSRLHGGAVRGSRRSRYRQWLLHKLSTWERQFGTRGCVGCGRCITWCPVGIDITEEAQAIVGALGTDD